MSVSLAVLAEAVGGLPGPRSERWKYTSLRALSARNFSTSSDAVAVDAAILAAIPEPRIVFVNGRFDAGLSRLDALATGLSVQALSQAPVGMPDGRFDDADETFARLNAALAEDGAVIRVAADTQVAVPMHLVFVGAASETDLAIHARHLVELREDATLIVIEHHLAAGAHRHLANHLVHIHLKPGSRLVHARVQDEDPGAALIARTDAVLASRSEYRRLDLELGGAWLAIGRQHVDTRLGVEHIARDTSCDLHWRGLASGRGRVAFHGGIVIRAGADGSDAALSSRNLLLSDGAEIDTQPVLEIHADEVKAAHGATVGRLNDTALFYLRSRGIPEAQARALLTLAFCREVLSVLDDPSLAESLSGTLEARLSELELAP
jgi:Fe-S cluster assembly protein SufD